VPPEKKVRVLNVRLSPSLYDRAQRRAREGKIDLSVFTRMALEDALDPTSKRVIGRRIRAVISEHGHWDGSGIAQIREALEALARECDPEGESVMEWVQDVSP
jgi:hypothetical protein